MATPPLQDEKAFSEMLEKSLSGDQGKLDLSKDEADKFKKAFDDPEFRKMFAEYMDEMQNPKHRDETESYIKQLEGEQKVPEGKQLVRPQPGFVAKAYKDGMKDEQGKVAEEKVFINIVQSEKIAEPTSVVSKEGTNWSLPYSLGPPHVEKDKKGDNVPTFDCCFHPEALKIAEKSKQFKDLLVQTAIEGIVETMKRQRQEINIKPTFHIVKGLKYKQGVVPSMLVDIVTTRDKWNINKKGEGETKKGDLGSAVKDEMPAKPKSPVKQTPPEPIIKRGFLNSKSPSKEFYNKDGNKDKSQSSTANNPLIQEVTSRNTLPKPPPNQKKVVEKDALLTPVSNTIKSDALKSVVDDFKKPRYTMKERGKVEMGDFQSNKAKVTSNRPAEIIYTFEVPLAVKPANISLDIEERTLKLSYEQVYEVAINLPYPVHDKKSSAKYNSKLKTLTVTIPVQAATIQYYESSAPAAASEAEDEVKEDAQRSRTKATKPVTANVHSTWVSSEVSEKEKESNKQMTEEIKKMAESAKIAEEINRSVASYKPPSPTKDKEPEAAYVEMPFLPSAKYSGSRKGYVFKTGDEGLGYYLDQPSSSTKKASQVPNQPIAATISFPVLPQDETPLAFLYETRETTETIAILVQVPNILKQSTKVIFNSTSFSIRFQAPDVSNNENTINYGMYFDQLGGTINASQSSYDIASENMVVVIYKEVQEIWSKSDDIQLFRAVKSTKDPMQTQTSTSSNKRVAEVAQSSPNPSKGDLITKLKSLQFSQSNALFDLD